MKSTILGLAFITAAFVTPSTGWGESDPAAPATVPAKTNCPKIVEAPRTAAPKLNPAPAPAAPAPAPASGKRK